MKIKDEELKKVLMNGNYLNEEDFKGLKKSANKDTPLSQVLISEGLVSKDILGQAISEWYKVPYADLNSNQPSRDQVLKINKQIALKYRVVLFSVNGKNVVVTTDEPKKTGLKNKLQEIFPGQKVSIALSVPEDIDEALVHYRQSLSTKFSEIIAKNSQFAPEIINLIIDDAISFKASDIHFEPQGKDVLIRFRVDGVLQEAGRVRNEYYENILNRIKIQARLRIDEHNNAQDGAIRFAFKDGQSIDLRVSVIPVLDGEKIVIRVLSKYIQNFSFNELGVGEMEEKKLNDHINKPFGLILSVGPTGSGKTTTLYTLVKKLNKPGINITTIEDPVEYKILGVNQIQVNNITGLTFAKGLRSIVRQDPNVILVGEIRDTETVQISLNAALTGHLVLSTFHANDAASTIPRLIDMGAEPFLLSSTIEVIIAQRLARKLCERCRYSETLKSSYLKNFPNQVLDYLKSNNKNIFRSKGCDSCSNTGYKGRIGLFETIEATPEFKDLILKNPSAQEIRDFCSKNGSLTLFKDGLDKVSKGLTSLEEVVRVAPPGD